MASDLLRAGLVLAGEVPVAEDVAAFYATGCNDVTILAQAYELLQRYAQSFEARGGAEVYGNDVLEIVYVANDLKEWMTPERAAVVARVRTDV